MPQTLGPYEPQSTLGAGAMGVTYRARDTRTGDAVALKVIHQPLSDDALVLAQIRHEAGLAERVQHPNIATILDQGEDAGHAYIASEFVEGESLASRLRADRRLPEAEAARIGLAAAHALNAAWAHHVLHRNLTPDNIVLSADGRVCLTDFGLTQAQDATTVTRIIAFIASPPYAAPELDERRGDTRADLYSLGAIMFQILTGHLPAARDASARPGPARQRDFDELRRAAPALAPIVRRLLQTKPDDRYAEPADVVSALEGADPFATTVVPESVVRRRRRLALALATVAIPFAWFFAWIGGTAQGAARVAAGAARACAAPPVAAWTALVAGVARLRLSLPSLARNRRLRKSLALAAAGVAGIALAGGGGYIAVQAIGGGGSGDDSSDGAAVVIEATGATRTPDAAAKRTPPRASPSAAVGSPAAASTPPRPGATPQRPRVGAIVPPARPGAASPAAAAPSPEGAAATLAGATATVVATGTPAPSSTATPIPPPPTPSPPPTATPTPGPITLVSGTNWSAASDAGALGPAQVVCLRREPAPVPPDCPPGATSWDRPGNGGWGASLAGAQWIWAPGIEKESPASDYAHYTFTQCFNAPAAPASGTIEVAVDRGADVLVNGTFAAWVTGANAATPLDITPMLRAGDNCITLAVVNDNACAPDCPYEVNPAGVLARVSITFAGG